MNVDVIGRGGRKKDFWDIHELMNDYSLKKMLELHKTRYPFNHNNPHLMNKLTDFSQADYDFDPVCLRKQHWEIIKLELLEFVDFSQ